MIYPFAAEIKLLGLKTIPIPWPIPSNAWQAGDGTCRIARSGISLNSLLLLQSGSVGRAVQETRSLV